MGTPHKHALLIKAWADGAEIQWYWGGKWVDVVYPGWSENRAYRIKPSEPVLVPADVFEQILMFVATATEFYKQDDYVAAYAGKSFLEHLKQLKEAK